MRTQVETPIQMTIAIGQASGISHQVEEDR